MSSTWGNKIKLSIFGESHGEVIGILLEGIPSGVEINLDNMKRQLNRRRPGKSSITTKRIEQDIPNIKTGVLNSVTTGAPILIEIINEDKRSKDYEKLKSIPRPGHSDYSALIKYQGFNDLRGGGIFSGRLTAPLVAAGSIARDILENKGIFVYSHIRELFTLKEDSYLKAGEIAKEELKNLQNLELPFFDRNLEPLAREIIEAAKDKKDSIGGSVECIVMGMPAGIGDPYFDSLESNLAKMLFSIPGIKGIEFGIGFDFCKSTGREVSDTIEYKDNRIHFPFNYNGGILGGISTGADIVFNLAIKPTPSIASLQKSVDLEKKQNVDLEIDGRHDPCILSRAIPVIESVVYLTLLDYLV